MADILWNFQANIKDLQALTLVGPTRENLILDPLSVLHLDNRLCIFSSFFADQQQRRQRLELDRQGHRVPLHRTIREQCRHSRKRKQRPGPQKIDNDDPNVGGKRHERRR